MVEKNTYINTTYNFQVSVFSDKWKINLKHEEIGDGISVAEFDESVYGAWGMMTISKFPQSSLEKFANVGIYQGDVAKFTFIAGKPAYFESKHVERRGFKITSKIYKFVNNNIGYVFSFGYLSKFDNDEQMQNQFNDILNSFTFLDEKGFVREISTDLKIKRKKLKNVALLEMVDLSSNSQNTVTKVLTNELQNELAKTGQFVFIERRNIKQILKEQKLQLTGLVSEDSAVKIGSITGASYLISSNMGLIDKTSVIYAQITSTENGKVISSASIRCRKCSNEMMINTLPSLVAKLWYKE